MFASERNRTGLQIEMNGSRSLALSGSGEHPQDRKRMFIVRLEGLGRCVPGGQLTHRARWWQTGSERTVALAGVRMDSEAVKSWVAPARRL